ncbi:MAG: hypothetical protein J6J36_03300 [Clostridia bacterium]|nr:hypothetical protein [Clostridia bacterium]
MVKTIDISGRAYNAYRNAGHSHMEAIEHCVKELVTELDKAGCFWVTNVATDRDIITVSASSPYAFPGESKPSSIWCSVIALNETDKDYCKLRESGLSEAEVRDELLNAAEADASYFGTIKAWHIAYVPGCAVVFASV